jgi:hypothetical protein
VRVLRDGVQADIIVLVIERDTERGGLGTVLTDTGYLMAEVAQQSIGVRGILSYVLPHELGHNHGMVHDHVNSAGASPIFPYAFGHRVPGRFSTIMAYQNCDQPCPLIPYYSNPAVSYDGLPTGVEDHADEARTLTQAMPIVASYRGCRTQLRPSHNRRIGPEAATVSWELETDPACIWIVEDPAQDWIRRTSPERGRARASETITITLDVATNTTPDRRGTALRVNGRWLMNVTQDGCFKSASPLQ